jgi:hypothetical protein
MILSEETLRYPAAYYCPLLGQYYAAGYLSVSSDNIILYRYVLMKKDNNIMLNILVFLQIIPYCTGMY